MTIKRPPNEEGPDMMTVTATPIDCTEECESKKITITTPGLEAGTHKIEGPDEAEFGTNGSGHELSRVFFDLSASKEERFIKLKKGNGKQPPRGTFRQDVTFTIIPEGENDIIPKGNRFPWLKGTDAETGWVKFRYGNSRVDESKSTKLGFGRKKPTTNIFHTWSTSKGDPLNFLSIYVGSTVKKFKIKVQSTITFTGKDQCGEERVIDIQDSTITTVRHRGLQIKRKPEFIFGDADYWVPIKVNFPNPDGFDAYRPDGKGEIENVQVSLRREKEKMETVLKASMDDPQRFDNQDLPGGDIDEINAELMDWGFGDGTTSQAKGQDVFKPKGKGDWKLRNNNSITVFVKLEDLLGDREIATSGGDPVHLLNKKKEETLNLKIPHFQVVVTFERVLQGSDVTLSFASLNPDSGRGKVFADTHIGPVLEPGEDKNPDLLFNKSTDFIGFPRGKELDRRKSIVRTIESNEVSTPLMKMDVDEVTRNDFPEDAGAGEFDRAKAQSFTNENAAELGVNLADFRGFGFGERVQALAKVRRTAYFVMSYGKNRQINNKLGIPTMNLGEDNFDVEIPPDAFSTRVSMGKDSQEVSPSVTDPIANAFGIVGTTAIGFFAGGPLGVILTVGGAIIDILDAFEPVSGEININARSEYAALVVDREGNRTNPKIWKGNVNLSNPIGERGDIEFESILEPPVFLLDDPFFDVQSANFPDERFTFNDAFVGQKIELVFKFITMAEMDNNDSQQVLTKVLWQSMFREEGRLVDGKDIRVTPK